MKLYQDTFSSAANDTADQSIPVHNTKEPGGKFPRSEEPEVISTLVAGIAHDFNNLLGGMFGYIDLAKEACDENSKAAGYLEKAFAAYQRAKDLTQQLRHYVKGERLIQKVASLANVVRESCELAVCGSKVNCTFSVDRNLWPVEMDESQIFQVINNIALNARQAMPEGGTIAVAVENEQAATGRIASLQKGKYVRIRITDQGRGIPEEDLPRIFSPFYTTKENGFGIGLATCRSIIQNHNGYISVDSKVHEGTTFTIYLPASEKGKKIKREGKKAICCEARGRVLVMDSEDIIRDLAGEILEITGFDVKLSGTAEEAVQLYKDALSTGNKYDAVILDLMVPGGIGGKGMLETLREADPDVRAIVASGYTDDPVFREPQKYGFKAFIEKPYKVKELREVVTKVIQK